MSALSKPAFCSGSLLTIPFVLRCAVLFILISLSNPEVAKCQNKELDALSHKKYVETFDNHFFIWPVLTQKSVSFVIQNHDFSRKLVYKPNFTYHAGVGAYIFGIGYQFTLAIPQSKSDVQQHGKSRGLSLQLSFKGENWGIDVFTTGYGGFYELDKSTPKPIQQTMQRQDVKIVNSGISGIYFVNKRTYSMRAADNYYERQLKSAGSMMLRGNYNKFTLHADSSIYTQLPSASGTPTDFQRINYTTLSIAPGYANNFVIKKCYFLSASFAFGPALNWFRFSGATGPWKSDYALNSFSDLRLGTGYNGERFFAGFTFIHQSTHINYDKTKFVNANDAIKFSVGYRFHEIGVMKRRAADFLKPKGR